MLARRCRLVSYSVWPSSRSTKREDRKSTRLNSSHGYISYAVFCLKKKNASEVPATSQVTVCARTVVFASATGSPIYTCSAGWVVTFVWIIKAPDANLHDRADKLM